MIHPALLPRPEGFWRDNPLTWHPDPDYVRDHWMPQNRWTPTAGWHTIRVDPRRLRWLPGSLNEHLAIGADAECQEWIARLSADMEVNGWREHSRPLIGVSAVGEPSSIEGNHRIRAAVLAGLDTIPVEVRYYCGSEAITGVWTPTGEPLPLAAAP